MLYLARRRRALQRRCTLSTTIGFAEGAFCGWQTPTKSSSECLEKLQSATRGLPGMGRSAAGRRFANGDNLTVPPPKHHRTVDRVTAILELVARSPHGLTLKQLATALEAPNSSILQLISGLVVRGYLSEDGKVYTLGPGAILLAHIARTPPVQRVPHSYLTAIHEESGLSVHLSVRLGDSHVAIDQVGLASKLDFLAWDGIRRPLLKTASGKIILANLVDVELHRLLKEAQTDSPEDVETFLVELPAIRAKGLAFNLGQTEKDVFSVAAAARAKDGTFIGAVSLSGPPEIRGELDDIGELLLTRVNDWRVLPGFGACQDEAQPAIRDERVGLGRALMDKGSQRR
jgi:DNA-binding IclR family transcriptional regulator